MYNFPTSNSQTLLRPFRQESLTIKWYGFVIGFLGAEIN